MANAENAEVAQTTAEELLAAGALIGLFQHNPEVWLAGDTEGLDDALIDQLIEERNDSRKQKNFARADEIRGQLQEMGIVLEDVAGATRWRRGGDHA